MNSHTTTRFLTILIASLVLAITACVFFEQTPTAVLVPTPTPEAAAKVSGRTTDPIPIEPNSHITELIRSVSKNEQDCFGRLLGEQKVVNVINGKSSLESFPAIQDLSKDQLELMRGCLSLDTLAVITAAALNTSALSEIDLSHETISCVADKLSSGFEPKDFPWTDNAFNSWVRCVSDNEVARLVAVAIVNDMSIEISPKTVSCMSDRIAAADVSSLMRQFIGFDAEHQTITQIEPELSLNEEIGVALGLMPALFCLQPNERAMFERTEHKNSSYAVLNELECFLDELGTMGLAMLAETLMGGGKFPNVTLEATRKCELPIEVLASLLPITDDSSERPFRKQQQDSSGLKPNPDNNKSEQPQRKIEISGKFPDKPSPERVKLFEDAVLEIAPCVLQRLSPDRARGLINAAGNGEVPAIGDFLVMFECALENEDPAIAANLLAPLNLPFDTVQFDCLLAKLGAPRIDAIVQGRQQVGTVEIAAVLACGIDGDELLRAFTRAEPTDGKKSEAKSDLDKQKYITTNEGRSIEERLRQAQQEDMVNRIREIRRELNPVRPCLNQHAPELDINDLTLKFLNRNTPPVDVIFVMLACKDEFPSKLLRSVRLSFDNEPVECLLRELGQDRWNELMRHDTKPGQKEIDAIHKCEVIEKPDAA